MSTPTAEDIFASLVKKQEEVTEKKRCEVCNELTDDFFSEGVYVKNEGFKYVCFSCLIENDKVLHHKDLSYHMGEFDLFRNNFYAFQKFAKKKGYLLHDDGEYGDIFEALDQRGECINCSEQEIRLCDCRHCKECCISLLVCQKKQA
jgi:hypothetical protein